MNNKGFTLIELMIVVAIIGILATIAYPSYRDSVRKANRSDGKTALTQLQLAQEKLRANCRFYAEGFHDTTQTCGANAAGTSIVYPTTAPNSPEGWYDIRVDAGADAVSYIARATAQNDQANDNQGGVSCSQLVLTVDGNNPQGDKTPVECW